MPPSWVTYHPALNRWVQRERTQTAAPKRDSSSGRRRRPDELSIKSAFGQNGVQANFLCCTTSPLREVKMRTSQEMFAQPRIAANRRDGWEILSRDCLSMALPRGVQVYYGFTDRRTCPFRKDVSFNSLCEGKDKISTRRSVSVYVMTSP